MTKPIQLSVNIPFQGFYCSLYSAAIDHLEERHIEDLCGGDIEMDSNNEAYWPAPLQLDSGDLANIMYDVTDYSAAYRKLAEYYVAAFDAVAGESLGFTVKAKRQRWTPAGMISESYDADSLSLKFEAMTSPREYNFETDRLFADMPLKVARELLRRSKAAGHKTLAAVIARRFTSRSGFISSYDNDIADWLAKPLRDWDHNELGTLLIAAMESAGADIESDDIRWQLYELTTENEGDYRAWESGVDWQKFEAKRLDMRADKMADWQDTDSAAAAKWLALNPEHAALAPGYVAAVSARCPYTLDMFAGL